MNLTPYDTGARLEPKPWVEGSRLVAEDDYGKVDFENDESVTELTIHVEREDAGSLVVHIYKHADVEVRVITEGE